MCFLAENFYEIILREIRTVSPGKLLCQVDKTRWLMMTIRKSFFIVPFRHKLLFVATTKACSLRPHLRLPMKMTCARDNCDHSVRYMQKSRLHQQKIKFRDWSRMPPFYGSGRRQLPAEYQIPH